MGAGSLNPLHPISGAHPSRVPEIYDMLLGAEIRFRDLLPKNPPVAAAAHFRPFTIYIADDT